MESQTFFHLVMAVIEKHPMAILAMCLLIQWFLTGNFPYSAFTIGSSFAMEAFGLAVAVVFMNVTALYILFLLIGTTRLTCQRSGRSLMFECILNEVGIENDDGSGDEMAVSTMEHRSTREGPSMGGVPLAMNVPGRKRSAPTSAETRAVDEKWESLQFQYIDTPFKYSANFVTNSIFSPSTTSMFSDLASPSLSTEGFTGSTGRVLPSTPPAWLGKKMMSSETPPAIGSPSPTQGICSIKTRRGTPFPSKNRKRIIVEDASDNDDDYHNF